MPFLGKFGSETHPVLTPQSNDFISLGTRRHVCDANSLDSDANPLWPLTVQRNGTATDTKALQGLGRIYLHHSRKLSQPMPRSRAVAASLHEEPTTPWLADSIGENSALMTSTPIMAKPRIAMPWPGSRHSATKARPAARQRMTCSGAFPSSLLKCRLDLEGEELLTGGLQPEDDELGHALHSAYSRNQDGARQRPAGARRLER